MEPIFDAKLISFFLKISNLFLLDFGFGFSVEGGDVDGESLDGASNVELRPRPFMYGG